ncbi:alcohol dehydrogenase-like protein [Rhodococcus sp. OK519]|nr:alcohol dehydrogenase-like protein [Rhodococcus sp. OK519]
MKAIQYTRIGAEPELVEIPTPEPGPGEVLLQITAAGVCHSDEFVMGLPAEQFGYDLPMTLGHEGAGSVAAVGAGVTDLEIGTNVVVYGPWGCGRCWHCAQGLENYCSRARELGIAPPGLGAPGAIAERSPASDPTSPSSGSATGNLLRASASSPVHTRRMSLRRTGVRAANSSS